MTNYGDFFYENIPEVRRPRILDEFGAKGSDAIDNGSNPKTLRQDNIDSVYKNYETAINKANLLISHMEPIAKKYRVPVPQESREVRQAVIRKDPDADPNFITFELFQRCVDVVEFQAQQIDYSVVDTAVTADPLANMRKMKQILHSELLADNDLMFLLSLGEQFLVLYLIHAITGIWRGSEYAGIAPPVSFAEALAEIAIGMATAYLVLGINATLSQALAAEGINNQHSNAAIKGAIGQASQINLPPLIAKSIKILGLDDHKTILKYAISYVSSTSERGYEFWLTYLSVRRTRYLSARSLSLSPLFSKKYYAKSVGLTVDDAITSPDNIPYANRDGTIGTSATKQAAAQVVNLLNKSITDPSYEFMCVQDKESSSFINGLNEIAQVLDTKVARDAVCCLIRFLGKIDKDLLHKIRTLIHIYLNANLNGLNVDFDKFFSYLINWIKDTILRLVLSLIQTIIDKVVRTILSFLNDLLLDIDFLLECPLILELIASIMDAVAFILNDLIQVVNNILAGLALSAMNLLSINGLNSSHNKQTTALYKIYRKRSLRRILAIIDKILYVAESGAELCDEEEKPLKEKAVTFNSLLDSQELSDIEDYLNVSDNDRNTLFNDAKEIILRDGSKIPSYNVNVINIGNPITPDGLRDCVAVFGDDLLNKVIPNEHRR